MIPFVSSSFLLVGAVALLRAKKTLKKTGRKVFRVYVDGCFDLMHFGHANALRQARAIASFASTGGKEGGYVEGAVEVELIVGLVSDEEILRCKGPPVLPEQERVKCVRAVKWVDDIIANVPYELTKEFMEELFSEKYGIEKATIYKIVKNYNLNGRVFKLLPTHSKLFLLKDRVQNNMS